jgi:hypothetical protein
MNLNANKLFKLTGALPQRPPDTRGTTEKAQDAEGSKVALRQKLGTVTDGVIASQIVGELAPEEILFALNKWEIINRDMKEQYAKGVPSSVFIAYLRRLIQRFEAADAIQNGLQQNTGEAIIMSNIQLLYGLPQKQLYSLVKSTIDRVAQQFGNSPLMDNVRQQLTQQDRMIPSAEDLRLKDSLVGDVKDEADGLMDQLFNNFPVSDDLVSQVGELNLAMARRDQLLARQALFQLLNITAPQDAAVQIKDRLDAILMNEARRRAGVPMTPAPETPARGRRPAPVRSGRRARSADTVEPPEVVQTPPVFRLDAEAGRSATAIRQPQAGVALQGRLTDRQKYLNMQREAAEAEMALGGGGGPLRMGARREVGRFLEEPGAAEPVLPELPKGIPPPETKYGFRGIQTKAYKVNYLNSMFKQRGMPDLVAVYTQNDGSQSAPENFTGKKIKASDFTEEQLEEIFLLTKPRVDNYYLENYGYDVRALDRADRRADRFFIEEARLGGREETQRQLAQIGQQAKRKSKMAGRGLHKPYKQAIAHLVDKPVEKSKPYTAFGRYYVNKERLKNKGFLALRVASGNVIKGLPTQKVSHGLSKVLLTLIAGQTPSYEDIGSLSKEDREKLSHICSSCHVDSPAVPHMKGEGEAEMDKFNVLRGEIIAGNDAPKIAREFKTMLLRFMSEGRIPRQQGNEILHEMLALGV